jgi:hypothetical protein
MRRSVLMGSWSSILIQIGQGLSATRFVDWFVALQPWRMGRQAEEVR